MNVDPCPDGVARSYTPDAADVFKQHYEQWTKASLAIHLDEAPLVVLRYEKDGEGITRMYLNNSALPCSLSDLNYHVTFYRDLFARLSSLARASRKRWVRLNRTATKTFWPQAAHGNGILGRDNEILMVLGQARRFREMMAAAASKFYGRRDRLARIAIWHIFVLIS